MHYASFLTPVEQVGGITREEAQRAIEATLRTLAERITGGVAREIAAFLRTRCATTAPTRRAA